MQNSKLLLSIPLSAMLLLTSCSNPERDFKAAEATGTEKAYGEFILKHPDSPLVAQAKAGIEKRAYQDAKAAGSSAAYLAFLKRFPASTLTPQASNDLAAATYLEAKRSGTPGAYEDFLLRFANSPDASRARTELEALEFELAGKTPAIGTWREFLKKHPGSAQEAEAKKALSELVFAQVAQSGTVSNLAGFLREFPASPHAPQAREKLAQQLFPGPPASEKTGAYEVFVKDVIRNGGNVNTNLNGASALMYASYLGSLDAVRYLVENGADINFATSSESALYLSDVGNYVTDSKRPHPEIVAYLLEVALKHPVLPSPGIDEIRKAVVRAVTDARSNYGGVGIELLTARRDEKVPEVIRVSGNVASWSGNVAMYHLGTWQFRMTLEGTSWVGAGERTD
jgi:TolA-binding protein